MPLVQCEDCHQSISDKSWFCPNCGCVRKQLWIEDTGKVYRLLALPVALLGGLFYFLSQTLKMFSEEIGIGLLLISGILYIAGLIMWKMKIKSD
jgi:hypothetical protein